MSDYKFPLKERFEVAESTMAFVFDTSGSDFAFRAGQYIEMLLNGEERHFSIASSPRDKGILMIATRMESPERPISVFKRSLRALPFGTPLKVEGPYGMFTLHQNPAKKAVFIAGGIGITPCRSILKDAAERKLPHKIALIYSNRNSQSAAFLEDLKNWEGENSNFKLAARMTDAEGYVDAKLIKSAAGDLADSIFYVVGPPAMVQGITKVLEELNISRDDIRFEEFTGY